MAEVVKNYIIKAETDNKEAIKGLKEINGKINNLSKSFSSLFKTAIFATAINGINNLVKSYKDLAINTDKLAKFTGLSTEAISKYEQSLSKLGISADETQSNLLNLSQNLEAVRLGGGNVLAVAQRFGIAFKNANGSLMKSDEYLKNLTLKLANYSDSTKKLIMEQLGLSENLQYQILDNAELVSQALNEQGGDKDAFYSQDDVKIAKELNIQYAKINLLLKKTRLLMSRFLAPIVIQILKTTQMLFKHIRNIFNFIERHQAFFTILLSLIAWNRLLKPILAMFLKIGSKVKSISGFIMSIKSALIPLLKIIGRFLAKFVLIPLLLDDLWVAIKGGNSYIGDFAKKFKLVENALNGIKAIFEKVIDFIESPSWKSLYNIIEEIGYQFYSNVWGAIKWLGKKIGGLFAYIGKSIYDELANVFNALGDYFKNIFNNIIEWFSSKINAIINTIKGAFDFVSNKVDKVKNSVSNAYNGAVDSIKGFFGFGNNTQNLAPVPVISGANNYSTTNNSNDNKQIIYNNQRVTLNGDKALNYIQGLNLMTMQHGNKKAL